MDLSSNSYVFSSAQTLGALKMYVAIAESGMHKKGFFFIIRSLKTRFLLNAGDEGKLHLHKVP